MRLRNSKIWIGISLLFISSLSSEPKNCCEPEEDCCCTPPVVYHDPLCPPCWNGYAASARETCSKVWVDGSFLYWQAMEENLELGLANTEPTSVIIATPFGMSGNVINMPFDFHPGFQVGIGTNLERDSWDAYAEYTRYLSKQTVFSNGVEGGVILAFQSAPTDDQGNNYNSGSGEWQLEMNLADLTLGRSAYNGSQLTLRPSFGARAAWIKQQHQSNYINVGTDFGTQDNLVVTQKSNSWGLGPKAGLEGSWRLGSGLKLIGNGSVDILFTRYPTLSYTSTHAGDIVTTGILVEGTYVGVSNQSVVQQDIGYLRAHLDLEFGLGYRKNHFDVTATYGFQVFYDQNMFRNFVNDIMCAKSNSPNGNLYIQGLTLCGRWDF